MKVQYDTGWNSLINKSLSEKSVDKLGETNQELSKYSSISTFTNVWTAKRLSQRKDRQKLPKRHRFPPSLLTSKAADLWNTLMPLRANCSCSSVSIGDKYSRLSFGVSISDASVGSNSDNSAVSPVQESAVRKTLGDTLEHTHLAFESLTARMVRLFNILNKKSGSSSSHVCSDSNLKILPPLNPKSKKNTKMIVRGSDNRFPSTTSLSNDSSNRYPDHWSAAGRIGSIGKKWESSSKFEIAEHKRRGKSFMSPTLLVPKTLRVTKSVLTKEELVYLLQCKKSLLSEYFQRKVDSTDLTKNLNSSEQKILIYGTQSDSRLQEDNLYQFVQFVRERKKNDAEEVLKKNIHPLETQKSNTNLTASNNEDSQNLSSPKRRVTFSDPLAEDNTSLLNCCSSENEDGILSVQSFTTTITSNVGMPRVQKIQSDTSLDSKSSSPSDSSVSLKACFANLSLKSHPKKSHDPNSSLNNFTIEQTVRKKKFTDERAGYTQPEYNGEIDSLKNSPCHDTSDVEMGEKELREEKDVVSKPLAQKLSQSGIREDIEQQLSNSDAYDRPLLPSGKTVTFKDCCKTVSEQSITSDQKELQPLLQSKDMWVGSSESKGRFELSWKGCWDRQRTTEFVQNIRKPEENSTEDEKQLVESKSTGIPTESIVSMPIRIQRVEPKEFSDDHEFSAGISDSQTSYYTTMKGGIQLANNYRLRHRRGNLGDTSPSSYSHPSNSPSFKAVASRLEKDEVISWMIDSKEGFTTPCKPASELKYEIESNPEAIKLRHHTEMRKGLGNVYDRLINPEIWRSEVRSEATDLCKSDWYTGRGSGKYSREKSEVKRNWLIRKLEELQSRPETDYDSDYYAESEIESDFECEEDLSLISRSFSNLNKDYENCRKFSMKRNRFRPNFFLNKVWSGKKIIFNECRCHKNSPSDRYDLTPREHDLRHKSFQESDQRSNQNFFSHLRARLILDSETEDSDFAPSIQPDFRYDFNRKDDHVNKIKCRRFVRSLRSIRSEEDRQFSSARFLHMTFQKSISPESLQKALSTRTVGTNVSAERQNFCNMMDVCIDTYDLCPRKQIGATNEASDLIFLNKNRSCQTVASFFITSNSIQCTKGVTQTSQILAKRDTPSGSNSQIPISNEQTISSTLENLSTHINNASNNLAKFRFSEIKTEPETLIPSPVAIEDNSSTTSHIPSCSPVLLHFSAPVNTSSTVQSSTKISSNFLNNSNHSHIEGSSCPICNARKEPERYVRPACVVKGDGPDSKTNEKDPWNRVMEQAQAQHRYERGHTSTCLEIKPSSKRSRVVCSANEPVHPISFERKQDCFSRDQAPKEEVRIQLVQVKSNSSQAPVCDSGLSGLMDKIHSPPLNDSGPLRFPSASALCSSTSYDPSAAYNLPRKRSPRRTKKPQAITNMSNRLLYIISETGELTHQTPIKSPAANFFI